MTTWTLFGRFLTTYINLYVDTFTQVGIEQPLVWLNIEC